MKFRAPQGSRPTSVHLTGVKWMSGGCKKRMKRPARQRAVEGPARTMLDAGCWMLDVGSGYPATTQINTVGTHDSSSSPSVAEVRRGCSEPVVGGDRATLRVEDRGHPVTCGPARRGADAPGQRSSLRLLCHPFSAIFPSAAPGDTNTVQPRDLGQEWSARGTARNPVYRISKPSQAATRGATAVASSSSRDPTSTSAPRAKNAPHMALWDAR